MRIKWTFFVLLYGVVVCTPCAGQGTGALPGEIPGKGDSLTAAGRETAATRGGAWMRTPGDSLPSTSSAPTDTSAAAPQTGRSRSLLREEDFQKARQRIAASEGDLEIAARAIEKAREADPQKSEELEAMGAEVRIQRERMAAISARLTEIENEWRAIYAMPAESGPIRRGPGITVPKRALKPGKGAIKGDSSAPAMPE